MSIFIFGKILACEWHGKFIYIPAEHTRCGGGFGNHFERDSILGSPTETARSCWYRLNCEQLQIVHFNYILVTTLFTGNGL